MRVSIVIPTYNCADLVGMTLRSIQQGGHHDIEVILIDGGSKDNIAEVVASFGDLVTIFVSEPDDGQYDAINKGMGHATGEILCWINGGDFFMPGALENAVAVFRAKPNAQWITGMRCIAEGIALRLQGAREIVVSDLEIRYGLCSGGVMAFLQQEGMFWRRTLWETVGGLDTRYRLASDYELWIRFAGETRLVRLTVPLAAFSYHGTNRSVLEREAYLAEVKAIGDEFSDRDKRIRKWLLHLRQMVGIIRKVPVVRSLLRLILQRIPSLNIVVVSWKRSNSERFKIELSRRLPWML
ncbi:MAG: glycosyltransferase family 2 protein [Verrucomicrobiota bacterium]